MTDFDGLKKVLETPGAAEEELHRLDRDRYSQVEFEVQAHHIKRLVLPGDKVIDIGAGPGRYAIDLLRHGAKVALTDLSESFVRRGEAEIKRLGLQAGLICARQQNALALDFKDGEFDHALLMGPLYSMEAYDERARALREAARVVKPGGRIFLTMLSALRCVAEMFYVPNLNFRRTALDSYAPRIDELVNKSLNSADCVRGLIKECGLEVDYAYGADSAAGMAFDKIDEMAVSEETWAKMVDVLIKLSADPAIAGLASHTTYVLRKS